MLSLFKKKNKFNNLDDFEKEILINIDGSNISTGMIGGYLLKLRKSGMIHLGYEFVKMSGLSRINIYSVVHTPLEIKMYFKDRCPAMVEQEVRESESMPHSFLTWKDGFREVVEYNPE